jgi:hypothetical protein
MTTSGKKTRYGKELNNKVAPYFAEAKIEAFESSPTNRSEFTVFSLCLQ